jgi:hypothetical protein
MREIHSNHETRNQMSTATMTNMSPAKWRVLNRLFFLGFSGAADARGRRAGQIMRDQDVSLETLRHLEADVLIVAHIGDLPIDLVDLDPRGGLIWGNVILRLTSAGNRKVTDTPANNVISMLAQAPRHTAKARNLRVEGEVDDETLKAMEQEGLIEGGLHLPVEGFRRIPDGLLIKLTRKGQQYFPR